MQRVNKRRNMLQKHVYTAWGERLEQYTERGNWDRLLYVHEDVMGNTMYYTKATGQTFSELRYDVWGFPDLSGKLQNNDNGNFAAATFEGHIYDTVIDVYFAEARFYDANNRTFMSTDPVKDGLNWYAYCAANPTTFFDPTGLYGVQDSNPSSILGQSDTGLGYAAASTAPNNANTLPNINNKPELLYNDQKNLTPKQKSKLEQERFNEYGNDYFPRVDCAIDAFNNNNVRDSVLVALIMTQASMEFVDGAENTKKALKDAIELFDCGSYQNALAILNTINGYKTTGVEVLITFESPGFKQKEKAMLSGLISAISLVPGYGTLGTAFGTITAAANLANGDSLSVEDAALTLGAIYTEVENLTNAGRVLSLIGLADSAASYIPDDIAAVDVTLRSSNGAFTYQMMYDSKTGAVYDFSSLGGASLDGGARFGYIEKTMPHYSLSVDYTKMVKVNADQRVHFN